MSTRERQLRAVLDASGQPQFDSFVLVISSAICIVFGLAALPVAAREPFEANIPLLIVVGAAFLLTTVQWLALIRRFGYDPPILAALVGVALSLVLAAYHGQVGALVGLAAGSIAAFVWRIVEDSETRLADVAYAVSAVALWGFMPAQGLLLRQLPGGITGYYLFLIGMFVFGIVQSLLSRPTGDGSRALGVSTALAGLATIVAVAIAAIVRGEPFGFVGGLLIGAAIAVGAGIGRALLPLLTPAPMRDGRRIKRRPMLADVLAPMAIASAAAFYAVRGVITP